MEVKRTIIGVTVGATLIAAVAAFVIRRKRALEARGHVPIGKSWEDRQLDWEGWPGGFSIRPD